MGKGVEDVERMIQVMIRHNKDDESIRPDIVTINGLVELAMSLKDPYLAERYIALGLKSGIQPDSRVLDAYAREPTGVRPNSSPASRIASLISK